MPNESTTDKPVRRLTGAAAAAKERSQKKTYTNRIPKDGVIYIIPNLTFHEDTKMPKCPSSLAVPPEDDIWVDAEGNPCPPNVGVDLVHIEYITGVRPVKRPGGVTENVPVKGSIELIWGETRVAPHEPKKYDYMEICNYNGSNVNRRDDKPILFVRHDPEGDKVKQANHERKVRKALADLEELWMNDRPTMKDYAISLSINVEQSEDGILADLEMKCKQDPDNFIKNSHSPMRAVKSIVKRAIQLGILVFAKDLNKVFWGDKTEITGTPPGQDQVDFFCSWLVLNEQNQTLDLLKRKVEGE